MSFAHLHVHTEYSLLDGFSKIPQLVQQAKDMGMQHLAITDHGAMYGVIDFFNAAKEAEIKPIIGMEAYMASRGMADRDPEEDKRSSHLLLLAENQIGYQNLLKIASAAQLEGFYYYPRIDHDFLAAHSEGLIATSGCLSAEIPRAINREKLDEAQKKVEWYYDVFGPDNFFFELQQHDIPELHNVNKVLRDMGPRFKANFIATNDVHYIKQEDARLQDILLCVQTSSLYSDPRRMKMSGESFYLRSPQEMANLFGEVPESLSNTLLIAERCNVDLSSHGYHLPRFDVPEGFDAASYLRKLVAEGLERRYPGRSADPEIQERMEHELGVIHKMGFDAYFLIVWDLCRVAKERGIWYNARGSAAGSIVAYALDITLVDPLEHKLIFERFLNEERVSMPDIDLDFQDDKRHLMMEYCRQKYGDDYVAAIITFNKLKARAAVRDVGRVLDVPLTEVDRIAKLIPNVPGRPVTIAEALETIPDFSNEYKSKPYVKELIDTAQQMEGVIRGAGTHAAGVVIADKPIIEYLPLNRPTGSNAEDTPIQQLTQFEMSTLDALGMLKVDFLGLTTLTIMERACLLIQQRHGVDLDLNNIPLNDPETFELLGRGETAGVFQFEGAGMRRWMMAMKPQSVENAIAMVALFRPGPMDFIPTYIARMHGEEPVSYAHPQLEEIFAETYGIAVYQEQLMQAAMRMAGYTAAEADDLRKAIAKKIEHKLKKHRKQFVKGAVKQGVEEETADKIFSDWENFARYGFNKAHAADYGVLAVQTAYLKVHYPVDYMTALLSVTLSDSDKVAAYCSDCRRMGIEVLPPDINCSQWDFTIETLDDGQEAVRFGLGAIKNVGHGPVDAVLAGRGEQPFSDLVDFGQRVDLRQVGKRGMEYLIKAGALDQLGSRHAMLEVMEQLISMSAALFHAKEVGQLTFFGADSEAGPQIVLSEVDDANEFLRRERLNWERELIGLYVSDHPLKPLIPQLRQIKATFSGDLAMLTPEERVRVAGLVKSFRSFPTKRGKMMAFVTIEDLEGFIDLVVFPSAWDRFSALIQMDKLIVVEGKVDAQSGEGKILVDKIENQISVVVLADQQKAAAPAEIPARQPAKQPAAVKEQKPRYTPPPPPEDFNPGDAPEPPEAFPPGWEQFADDHYEMNALPEGADMDDIVAFDFPDEELAVPQQIPAPAEPEPALAASPEPEPEPSEEPPAVAEPVASPTAAVVSSELGAIASQPDPAETPPPALPSLPRKAPADRPPRRLTVYLRSRGDKMRDILAMRRVHGAIISYPGSDQFAFYVFEGRSGYLLDFPNDTTDVGDELLFRLEEMVGANNFRVEDITIQ